MLIPLRRMWDRYKIESSDSDSVAFFSLLYTGELITKLLVSGLLSGVDEDRDRHRYDLMRSIVRADGIGEWADTLDALVQGPVTHYLREEYRPIQTELTQRVAEGAWQYEALTQLNDVLAMLHIHADGLGVKAPLRQWFRWFALLRNKTRGHGAPLGAELSQAVSKLEQSIRLISVNSAIFSAEWAYLHRNLSGKYRVTELSGNANSFSYLKSSSLENYANGVYLCINEPRIVELLFSDSDATDFWVPNGQFRGGSFEAISYITNTKIKRDGSGFIVPSGILPESETRGLQTLDAQGRHMGNLPGAPAEYVRRESLEKGLETALLRERHEIVTLSGPGGIGKTSLALTVLHDLGENGAARFDNVIWFSARDIDLLESGPKSVRPDGVSVSDFAKEYVALVVPKESDKKDFCATDFLAGELTKSSIGPSLFVFDNFETVISPADLFSWIDTYIRSPNKVLITTRTREFVGDFPIEVSGMSQEEAAELIESVSKRLGVTNLITEDYAREIYDESGGHPYVVKILLGEVAKEKMRVKPRRIIATKEQMLQALFERTYGALTPAAKRVFLVLSSWRSVVPTLVVEGVLMHTMEERFDVRAAIDELARLSLVEEVVIGEGEESFLRMPLAAVAFGKKKLATSPLRIAVQADSEMMQAVGASAREDVTAGVYPRVARMVRSFARQVSDGRRDLGSLRPILEFLSGRVPRTWIDLADLYAEEGGRDGIEWAVDSLRRYLESGDTSIDHLLVWGKLAKYAEAKGDIQEEVHALVEMATTQNASNEVVSRCAESVNRLLAKARRDGLDIYSHEEKRLLITKLIERMERKLAEFDATDISRLAWLHLSLGNESRALGLAGEGLKKEPYNEYCRRLVEKNLCNGA